MKRTEKTDHPVMFKARLARETIRLNTANDYLLINVAEGNGTMNINGTDQVLRCGDIRLVTRLRQVTFKTEEMLLMIVIRISVKAVEEFLLRNKPMAAWTARRVQMVETIEWHILIKSFFTSIEPGLNSDYRATMPLTRLKLQECIGILVSMRPELYSWFVQTNCMPKTDLHEFMETHYSENLPLAQLAKASGRSLSTFRREFIREFGTTPGKWLLTKRLQEAYKLITQSHKPPSSFVYSIGFESLPHFSRCFKSAYGIPPSVLLKNI